MHTPCSQHTGWDVLSFRLLPLVGPASSVPSQSMLPPAHQPHSGALRSRALLFEQLILCDGLGSPDSITGMQPPAGGLNTQHPHPVSPAAAEQINDRYEFPDVLDLDREDRKYLSPTADRSVRNK